MRRVIWKLADGQVPKHPAALATVVLTPGHGWTLWLDEEGDIFYNEGGHQYRAEAYDDGLPS